jgi:hypothetical protein
VENHYAGALGCYEKNRPVLGSVEVLRPKVREVQIELMVQSNSFGYPAGCGKEFYYRALFSNLEQKTISHTFTGTWILVLTNAVNSRNLYFFKALSRRISAGLPIRKACMFGLKGILPFLRTRSSNTGSVYTRSVYPGLFCPVYFIDEIKRS